MARRRRTSLREAANVAALGGRADRATRVEGEGGYAQGEIDDLRLRAYYPVTRDFYDVTSRLMTITWTDSADAAAIQGSMSFWNGDGKVGSFLNRPGMIYFLETRAERHRFRERYRFVAWATEASDLNQGTLTVNFFDHMKYLATATKSFSFTANKRHKRGWKAHEITAAICRQYRIPVHSLVRTRHRIKKFTLGEATAYDAIVRAYAIDSKKTGNHYFVEMVKGKLRVRRSRKRSFLLALTDNTNIRAGAFSRALPDNFANTVITRGGTKRRGRKTKDDDRNAAEQSETEKRRRNRARSRRGRRRKVSKEDRRLASSMLFGNIVYEGRSANAEINDPDYRRKSAQALANRLSRAQKTLRLTCNGNVLIRSGDRVWVAFRFSDKRPLRKEVHVSSVTHTITGGDYTMDLTLAWRAKQVRSREEGSIQEAPPKERDTNKQRRDRYDKQQLRDLAESVGFPDPNLAAAVAMAESGGDPQAKNTNKDGSRDRGLWQINTVHKSVSDACAFDPVCNAKAALRISSKGKNWSPWVTYNTGAYRKHM